MKIDNKLKKIDLESLTLEDIDEDRRLLAFELIDELKFIKETLIECKKLVKDQGTVELFTQGAYSYNRETPAIKIYNSSVKNYCLLMKQLIDLFPKQEKKPLYPDGVKPGDDLIAFLNS